MPGPITSGPITAEQCGQCAEPVGPTDQFCERCGANLTIQRGANLSIQRGGTAAAVRLTGPCRGCGHPASADDAGYCPGCGLAHRDGTDHVEIDLGALAGVSDRGHLHTRNEDAMALGLHATALHATGLHATGLHATAEPTRTLAAVVCDGVSTVHSPELASRAATEAALDVLLGGPTATAGRRTRDAVAAAARAVAALAPPGTVDGPSCTFVSALVDRSDPERPEITVGWVGDSRAYWLAEPGAAEPARLLTADHACAQGITRWLGQDGTSEPDTWEPNTSKPDVVTLRPASSGVLLLCSDGLSRYLPDPAALAPYVMSSTGPAQPLRAAAELTAVALAAGGRDNVTAVVVPITVRRHPS